MLPGVVKLIKKKTRTVAFLDSTVLRYATYDSSTETLNVGNHDDVVITSRWVTPQRFSAFLRSEDKESYWIHKIVTNQEYMTRVRHFDLEDRINRLFAA